MKIDLVDNNVGYYAVSSFTDHIEDIVDQKFQKAWRLIKKTRWQGHYNTRKKSRRF